MTYPRSALHMLIGEVKVLSHDEISLLEQFPNLIHKNFSKVNEEMIYQLHERVIRWQKLYTKHSISWERLENIEIELWKLLMKKIRPPKRMAIRWNKPDDVENLNVAKICSFYTQNDEPS